MPPVPAAEPPAFAPVSLECAGRQVATYEPGNDLSPTLSPRPYLHPVRTLEGSPVTEFMPADHAHHLGVSVAVPDVSGINFWGGRTFVPDQGPTWLDDHGRQLHRRWKSRGAEAFSHELSWVDPRGRECLAERRHVAAVALGETAWALVLGTRLRNTTEHRLLIGSPATNGRPGAGYGGFFWRAPMAGRPFRCLGPSAEGERRLHGTRTEWLALSGTAARSGAWTLVFLAPPQAEDPWFVRVEEYPGVGSALAWELPLSVEPGGEVARHAVTIVADGALRRREISALVAQARQATTRR